MFNLVLPWWDLVIRAVVIYVFLIAALRLAGKRQVGQLAPFDFVLLLILSNAVQNSMNGGDNSLVGGVISACALLAVNYLLGWLIYAHPKLSGILEGKPEIIIHDGRVNKKILRSERITQEEIDSALRKVECKSIHDVHFAILETNGAITIKRKESKV